MMCIQNVEVIEHDCRVRDQILATIYYRTHLQNLCITGEPPKCSHKSHTLVEKNHSRPKRSIIGKSYVFSDTALKNGIVYGVVANIYLWLSSEL